MLCIDLYFLFSCMYAGTCVLCICITSHFILPLFLFSVLHLLYCSFCTVYIKFVEKWNVSVNNKLSEHWTRRDSVEVDVYCKKYILVKSRRLLSSSVWHKKKSWRSRREEYVFKINVKNLESCETAHMFLDARAPRSSSGRRTFFFAVSRDKNELFKLFLFFSSKRSWKWSLGISNSPADAVETSFSFKLYLQTSCCWGWRLSLPSFLFFLPGTNRTRIITSAD